MSTPMGHQKMNSAQLSFPQRDFNNDMANKVFIRQHIDSFKEFIEDYKNRVYSIDIKMKQKAMQEKEERETINRLEYITDVLQKKNKQDDPHPLEANDSDSYKKLIMDNDEKRQKMEFEFIILSEKAMAIYQKRE